LADIQHPRSAWRIDERAHAGPEHLDPAFVPNYDHKQRFDPTPDVEQLRSLGLGPASTLLDFGAGTGTLSVAAAPFCRRVVAIDISDVMLGVLAAKAKQAGVQNIDVVQQGILVYEHRGEPADFACSRNVLHSLPDFWKAVALHRIASSLKPGGVFLLRDLVFCFEPAESAQVLEAWFAGAPSKRPEHGYTREDYETHVRTEFSTFSWLLEPMLEHAGFEIREKHYRESRTFGSYSCVRR
jgi:SAM-dependent methyltransferase